MQFRNWPKTKSNKKSYLYIYCFAGVQGENLWENCNHRSRAQPCIRTFHPIYIPYRHKYMVLLWTKPKRKKKSIIVVNILVHIFNSLLEQWTPSRRGSSLIGTKPAGRWTKSSGQPSVQAIKHLWLRVVFQDRYMLDLGSQWLILQCNNILLCSQWKLCENWAKYIACFTECLSFANLWFLTTFIVCFNNKNLNLPFS